MDDMEKDLRASLQALMASQSFVGSASLAELGWADVFEESSRLAVQTLFEEAGRAAVATAGRDVMVSLVLSDEGGDHRVLAVQKRSLEGVDDRGVVAVHRALVTSDPDVVVVLDRRGAEVLGGAEIEAETTWSLEEVIGGHADSKLRLLTGQGRLRRRLSRSEAEALDRMVLLALSHERCGVALGLLDVAVSHVSERHQFGVPIGSLQAVQHRLAGVKVAVEAALSSLDAAWDAGDEVATLVAVALSATALTEAVRDCLQVCGGMGFTDEFPLAKLMRRGVVLQGSGPSAREAETLVGNRLVEAGVIRIGEIDRITEGRVSG